MPELLSALDAPREEFDLRGQRKRMTWFTPRGRTSGPEVFYSETLGPDALTRAHFHEVDQFQLFVEGGQRLGSTPIEPVTLHYADAHTPYGPIVGGGDGVHYLTYRAIPDPGARFMPESRALRRRFGGRHATVRVPSDQLAECAWSTLVDPTPDGLFAGVTLVPPDCITPGISPNAGIGCAYVVIAGTLVDEGRAHPPLSSIFVDRGGDVPTLRAGRDGATIVALSFPDPSERT